jgi:hypothetical protein
MKRSINTAALLAALFSITVAAVGCGSNSTPTGTGIPGYGTPGYGGTVTALPGGGLQISFSGTNVYDSGVRITAATAGFQSLGVNPTLTLGSYAVAAGQPGTLTGTSRYYPGSTITMITTQPGYGGYGGYGGGASMYVNISGGSVTLTPQWVMDNFGSQALPAVQGLGFDLYITNNSIYGGTIYVCTSKDASGNCHGAYLQL